MKRFPKTFLTNRRDIKSYLNISLKGIKLKDVGNVTKSSGNVTT